MLMWCWEVNRLTFVHGVLAMSNSLKWPQHSCLAWPQWGVVVKVTTATESRLNSMWHIPFLRGAANILVKKWWMQIKFTETDINFSVPDQCQLQWPKSGHTFRSWASPGAWNLLRLPYRLLITKMTSSSRKDEKKRTEQNIKQGKTKVVKGKIVEERCMWRTPKMMGVMLAAVKPQRRRGTRKRSFIW